MNGLAKTAAALLCVLPLAAQAADKDARMREALRRAQENVAQLQQEKAALDQSRQALESRVAELPRQLDKLKAENSKDKARASAMEHNVQALTKEVAELRAKLAASERSLTDAADARRKLEQSSADDGKRLEGEKLTLANLLKQQYDATQVCEAKNAQLAGVASELMQRYQNKGVWSVLSQAEPVLQLKAVDLENLLEQYRDRVAEASLATTPGKAP